MFVRFLGTGSALNSIYNATSLLINNNILIDAPPSISVQFHKYKLNLNELDVIIITHLHGDHYFGLPLLLIEYMVLKRNRPLKIFGPEGLKNNLLKLMQLAFPESSAKYLISFSKSKFFNIEKNNVIKEIDKPICKPIRMSHGNAETYGLEINNYNERVFFSSDTQIFEGLKEIISKCTFCILDGTSFNLSLPGHMSYKDIIAFSETYPNNWFFVTHRSTYKRTSINEHIFFPMEGDVFKICNQTKPIRITNAIKQE
jgi:ribonuclease BN (tRNA processing enzyme)